MPVNPEAPYPFLRQDTPEEELSMRSTLGRGRAIGLSVFPFLLAACSTYATPGRAADMTIFTDVVVDEDIEALFEREPAAAFPAHLAVVRVQAPNYSSWSHHANAEGGAYSVITTREIEEEADLERLAELPLIEGVGAFNRLLAPSGAETDEELRHAAARLRADLLLIYTIDSIFFNEGRADPLGTLTLGILATDKVQFTSTASAILVDTRTGFVYGAAEFTAREDHWQHLLTSDRSVDGHRIETEKAAFQGLIDEFERLWTEVLAVRLMEKYETP